MDVFAGWVAFFCGGVVCGGGTTLILPRSLRDALREAVFPIIVSAAFCTDVGGL